MSETTSRWSKVSTSSDTECSVTPNCDGIPADLRVWFKRKLWGVSEFYPFLLSKSVSSVLRINDATLQFWFHLFFPSFFHSFSHPSIHSFIIFSSFRLTISESRCLQVVRKYNEICSIKVIKSGNAGNKCTKKTTVCFEVFT